MRAPPVDPTVLSPPPGERAFVRVRLLVPDRERAAARLWTITRRLNAEVSDPARKLDAMADLNTRQLSLWGDSRLIASVLAEVHEVGHVDCLFAERLPIAPLSDADGSLAVRHALDARDPLDPRAHALQREIWRRRTGPGHDDGVSSMLLFDFIEPAVWRASGVFAHDVVDRTDRVGGGASFGGQGAALDVQVLTGTGRTPRAPVLFQGALLVTPREPRLGALEFLIPFGTLGVGVAAQKGRVEGVLPLGFGVEWIRGPTWSIGSELRLPLYFASSRGAGLAVAPMFTVSLAP